MQAEGDVTLPDLPHGTKVFVQPWQKKDWLVSIRGPRVQCLFGDESEIVVDVWKKLLRFSQRAAALPNHN
jgi:hypothetical protein